MKFLNISLVTLCLFALNPSIHAGDFYMALNGDDRNPGTLEAPFATLQHSLNQLQAGDVLFIRGGTYHQDSVVTDIKGTAGAPIVIQSYPGERAAFSAAFLDFVEPGNDAWELIDSGKNIYKSRQTYPKGSWPAAWLIDADNRYNNVDKSPYDIRLNAYKVFSNLYSECGDDDYMGPGIARDDSGYFHIRLEMCPNDLLDSEQNPIEPVFTETDPRQKPIAISNSTFILQLDSAAYVEIEGIDFLHATNMTPKGRAPTGEFECGYHPFIQSLGNIDIRNGSQHITLTDLEIIFGNVGLTVNGGLGGVKEKVEFLDINNCHLYQGFPDWFTWRDVKGGGNQFWPEGNSFAFMGELINSSFNDNNIHHTLDGIYIKNGTVDSEVLRNYFWYMRDDAIDFESYVSNLNVGYNILRHVYEGISIVGYPYEFGANGGVHGDIYIHHNVIDVTEPMRRNRLDGNQTDVWDQGKVWGSHSCNSTVGSGCPFNLENFGSGGTCLKDWTVYNNTIIGTERDFTNNQRLFPSGSDHFKNNIVYVIDDLEYNGCNYCEGNIFWLEVGNCRNRERGGACVDPGFIVDELTGDDYGPNAVDFYKSINPEVLTPGVSLPASWPDSQNDYRGAFATLRANSCPAPQGLGVENITTTSALLTWADVDSALDYDLRYRDEYSSEWVDVFDITEPMFELTDLTQNTAYEWQIRSSCSDVNSLLYVSAPEFTTLIDPSLPVVSISADDSTASEEGQDPGSLTLRRDKSNGELVVYLQRGGSASLEDIEETVADSIFFEDGDSNVQITVTPIDDIISEGDQTLEFTIDKRPLYNRGASMSATVNIIDNDDPDASLFFLEELGEVVMEAEHFHGNSFRFDPELYVWTNANQVTGFVDDAYITTPAGGRSASWGSGCESSYRIEFSTPGTYHVWLRRFATGGTGNSVFVGLDNAQSLSGAIDETSVFNEWVWVNIDSIEVASAAFHTFQIRRREAGYALDRIVLRLAKTAPSGTGPAESQQMSTVTHVDGPDDQESVPAPREFVLRQNYPNPFNMSTIIRYGLPTASQVDIKIYDLLGRLVRTLHAGTQPAGQYAVTWDGRDDSGYAVSSGVYVYKMESADFTQSFKLVLTK